jgi:hypothetical protein
MSQLYSDLEAIMYQECDTSHPSEHSASSIPEGMVQICNVHSFNKQGEIAGNRVAVIALTALLPGSDNKPATK